MKSVKAVALLVFALSAVLLFGGFVDRVFLVSDVGPSPYAIVGYIKIPGIQGSSKDPAHLGWIEVNKFSFEQQKACWAVTNASLTILRPPSPSSGEAKLEAMCRAHIPVAEMRIDVPGAPPGPHTLQNIQFQECSPVVVPNGGETETFRYSNCAVHHKPAPVAGVGSHPQDDRPAR